MLGLFALGWALLCAPALHLATHVHGHAHQHGPDASVPADASRPHGAGSLEHQSVAFLSPAATPALRLVEVPLVRAPAVEPRPAVLVERFAVACPQGPPLGVAPSVTAPVA